MATGRKSFFDLFKIPDDDDYEGDEDDDIFDDDDIQVFQIVPVQVKMDLDFPGRLGRGAVGRDLHELKLDGNCQLAHQVRGERHRSFQNDQKDNLSGIIFIIFADLCCQPGSDLFDFLLTDQYFGNIFILVF